MILKITLIKTKLNLILGLCLMGLISTAQDFNIRHIQDNVPRSGKTNNSFTAVSSLERAFVIPNSNRKTHGGLIGSASNLTVVICQVRLDCQILLHLNFYREPNSANSDTRFNASIIEYTWTY